MKKQRAMWASLIGGILCLILAVVLVFTGVLPDIKNKNILKNGKEATATVDEIIDHGGGNSLQTFYIKFTFINDDGIKISDRTRDYVAGDLEDRGLIIIDRDKMEYTVVDNQTIQIMYIGNEAVAKDFVTKNFFMRNPVAFCAGTGGVGIICLIFFIYRFRKLKKEDI